MSDPKTPAKPANDNGDFDPFHGGEVVPLFPA